MHVLRAWERPYGKGISLHESPLLGSCSWCQDALHCQPSEKRRVQVNASLRLPDWSWSWLFACVPAAAVRHSLSLCHTYLCALSPAHTLTPPVCVQFLRDCLTVAAVGPVPPVVSYTPTPTQLSPRTHTTHHPPVWYGVPCAAFLHGHTQQWLIIHSTACLGAGGRGARLTAPSCMPHPARLCREPCSILAEAARLAKQRLAEEELRAQALRERERDAPQLEQGELETEPGELPIRKKPKHERIVWRGAPGGSLALDASP